MITKRYLIILAIVVYHLVKGVFFAFALDSVTLMEIPPLPKGTYLFEAEKHFGYRGKIGAFVLPPSRVGTYYDNSLYFEKGSDRQSIKVMYSKKEKGFCGSYIIILGDISSYKTMTFWIKGRSGGETFEIGMNDVISNKREDAVYVGSINRYLPDGITTSWQLVKIPLSDFYGPDLSRVYSIVFHFNQEGEGVFWIDELRFYKEDLVTEWRKQDILKKGYFLLDDFDYSDLNLLGRKTNAYKKLPSVCRFKRVEEVRYGQKGRSLRLTYDKRATGWCGYYTLLNQIDGEYYDLRPYESVSFMVKGKNGGEKFELGMADKNWLIIGDSLKAGSIEKYLPGGVTTEWQEVIIPLADFGLLDFSKMGSFVINFNEKQEGTIYIDDLKFYLKKERSK